MVGKGYKPIRVDRTGECLQFGICKQTGIIIIEKRIYKNISIPDCSYFSIIFNSLMWVL